ncbi:MAG: 16S rRNA (guanine966-N2)-methyltransferase [Oceanicoccus sp.]|jgi:16S rRNA (guanine966-N2)-methyltransferase
MTKSTATKKSKNGLETNANSERKISQDNRLRIIGGQWRGRKISFLDSEGLRPTSDRVRETLFNWLAPFIANTNCLDLFAGSGALGFEALSRGAAHVDLVDSSPIAVRQLQDNLKLLKGNGNVWLDQAQNRLRQCQKRYEIIFLDPPFTKNLLAPCIELIEEYRLLTPTAWVYIETGRKELLPSLPAHWQQHREKEAGQVSYRLFSVNAA